MLLLKLRLLCLFTVYYSNNRAKLQSHLCWNVIICKAWLVVLHCLLMTFIVLWFMSHQDVLSVIPTSTYCSRNYSHWMCCQMPSVRYLFTTSVTLMPQRFTLIIIINSNKNNYVTFEFEPAICSTLLVWRQTEIFSVWSWRWPW